MVELEKTEVSTVNNERVRGSRGNVGEASPGLAMRQLWHAANSGESLKAFARRLVKEGNTIARSWLENKKGKLNAKRNDKNIQRVSAERTATKASKRKSGKK
jgi:hypothetical protein